MFQTCSTTYLTGEKSLLGLVVKHYVCQVNISSQAPAGLVRSFAQFLLSLQFLPSLVTLPEWR